MNQVVLVLFLEKNGHDDGEHASCVDCNLLVLPCACSLVQSYDRSPCEPAYVARLLLDSLANTFSWNIEPRASRCE